MSKLHASKWGRLACGWQWILASRPPQPALREPQRRCPSSFTNEGRNRRRTSQGRTTGVPRNTLLTSDCEQVASQVGRRVHTVVAG